MASGDKRRPGRPQQLTDEFLRGVTRLAREAWVHGYPINDFVAVAFEKKLGRRADIETVRGWRKAAAARRRQSPADGSFLHGGELRGKPASAESEWMKKTVRAGRLD